MATFDFRILLETVEGQKTSYISQSFVNTSDDLVLSASQVYGRITGSVSASYQNQTIFSGSDFNTNFTFKDNTLLSASISGSSDLGSIEFTSLNTEYDRLYRYKFFGEKVCNVLGLPHAQWIYVDQFSLQPDDDNNFFEGNVNAQNLFIGDSLTFANDSTINSDVPFLIDTGSDRHIKFIDERNSGSKGLIIGYDKSLDVYEISGSKSLTFNIGGLDKIVFSDGTIQETAGSGGGSGTVAGSNTQVQFNNSGNFGADANFTFNSSTDTLSVTNIIATSANITHVTSSNITSSIVITSGSNIFGDEISDTQTFKGHITASGNISSSGTILANAGTLNTLTVDDITIDDSKISDAGNLEIEAGGHLILDVTGDTTIDSEGDIVIDANGGDVFFKDDGTTSIRFNVADGHITASGNISASHTGSFGKMTIGTSTMVHENTQLTVAGGHGGYDLARFTRNDSGTSFVGINANALDPQIRFYEGSDYAAIGVDATNSNLVFATGSKVNGKEAMVIDTDGKVGIGTTSPERALEIKDTSNNHQLQLTAATNMNSGIKFTDGTDADAAHIYYYHTDKRLRFYTDNTEQMNILANGNVGIGTTSPIAPLHIATTNTDTDNNLGDLTNPRAGILINNLSTDANTYAAIDFRAGTHDARIAVTNGGTNVGNMNFIVDNGNSPIVGMALSSLGNASFAGHITASGNISASGTIIANDFQSSVGGSGIDFNDNLDIDGNVTASGNISASGDVFATRGNFPTSVNTPTIASGDTTEVHINDNLKVTGNITASENISASGELKINNITSAAGAVFNNDGGSGAFQIKGQSDDTMLVANLSGNDRIGIGQNPANDKSKLQITGDLSTTTHITASGNISSSGNLSATGNLDIDGTSNFASHITASGDVIVEGNLSASGDVFGEDVAVEKYLKFKDFDGGSTYTSNLISRDGNVQTFNAGFAVGNYSDGGAPLAGAGKLSVLNQASFGSHITASGNISGSKDSFLTVGRHGTFGHVASTSTGQVKIITRNADNSQLVLASGTDGHTMVRRPASSTGMQLIAGDTIRVNILQDGKVGIGNITPSEKLDVDGNIKTDGNISSPTFESGFAGSGFRIESGSDGKTAFTVDDLTVRGTMNVFELLIHQIRATNGSLFVSNTGKITSASISASTANHYDLIFDTGSGYGHSFVKGDLVRAQRFVPDTNGSGSQVFKSDLHILSVNGTGSAVGVLTGSDDPQPGYEYVRIGNLHAASSSRQGSIYLTSDDENAPFIDVVDGIDAHSDFNTSGRVKTRLGKLDGITTSERFGTLSGYGFYASGSVFLEGSVNATSGSIGSFIIDNTEIKDKEGTADLRLKSSGQITGSKVLFDGGKVGGFDINDISISDADKNLVISSSGQITGSKVLFTNGNIGGFALDAHSLTTTGVEINDITQNTFISTNNFKVSHTGNITASNVQLSGSIKAESGDIGGFEIDEDEIKSTNLLLDSTNEKITLGSSNAVILQGGGTDNFIAMGSKTSFTHEGSGTAGILIGMDNTNPQAEFVKDANNHLIFDDGLTLKTTGTAVLSGSSVEILTPKFFLGSATNNISSSADDLSITTKNLTASGSSVEVLSPNVFLGVGNLNFISASGGNLEISSSNFHLLGGNITASSVDLSGKITADEGEIGGFTINETSINANSDNLILNDSGQITMSGGTLITTTATESAVRLDGINHNLSFIESGSDIIKIGELSLGGGKQQNEFGIEIQNAEAQLFVSKSSSTFGGTPGIGTSTMQQGAAIRSEMSILDDSNANLDGLASIYGRMKYFNSSVFNDSGMFAGVVGVIEKKGASSQFRSAGVVGFDSSSAPVVPVSGSGGYFKGIPTKAFGVVSVGDSYVSGSLEVAGPAGDITASGTIEGNRVTVEGSHVVTAVSSTNQGILTVRSNGIDTSANMADLRTNGKPLFTAVSASGNMSASGIIVASAFYTSGDGTGGGNDPDQLVSNAKTGSLIKSIQPSATQGQIQQNKGDNSAATMPTILTNLGTSGKPTFAAITSSGEITSSTLKIASDAQFGPSSVHIDGVGGHITASGNISSSGTGDNYFGGNVNIVNDSGTELNFIGTNNTNITTAGNMYIKAASSKKLYLGAGGTDSYVTLDTDGEVGIGDTSPDAKLDVAGDLRVDEDIYVGTHITASGNISSSGTITANAFVGGITGTVTGTATGLSGTPDITVGSITATSLNVTSITSSIVTSSILQTEGSNIFGDTVADTHTFNGGIIAGNITASGNISASGELSANTVVVGSTISHIGDTNTLISFGTDTLTFKAGNEAFITIIEDGSQDNIVIGDGGDIDFHVKAGGDNTLFAQGSSQRIGIGTSSPTLGRLHISGSGDANNRYAALFQTTGSISYLKFADSTTGVAAGDGFDIGANSSTAYLINRENAAMIFSTNNTERVRILAGGNVGIGTTSPERLLSVSASVASHPLVTIENASGGSGGGLQIKTTDGNGTGTAFEVINYKNVSPQTIMKIPTWKTATNIGATFPKGYVGIGTETPTAALQVEGVISASGGISSSGDLRVDGIGIFNSHITASGNISATAAAGASGYALDISGSTDDTRTLRVKTAASVGANAQVLVEGNTSNGSPALSTAIDIRSNADYRGRGIILSTATGSENERWFAGVPYTGAGYSIGFSDAASNNLPWYDVSSSLFIQEDGDVGIGTSSPATNLHVSDTAGSNTLETIRIENSNGYGELGVQSTYVRLLADGNLTYAANNSQTLLSVGGATKATLNSSGLNVDGHITASGNISSSGNILTSENITALGTITAEQLTSTDDITAAGTIKSSLSGQAILSLDNTATNGDEWNIISKVRGSTSMLEFRNVDTSTDAVAITSAGKVGIGTTAPTKPLQVEGDISSSGAINTLSHITASGNYSGSVDSTFRIGGKLIAGSKSFVIDRPEGGKLEYGVLEGQQNDVFFRGELKGDNVIYLPQEWEWLVDENTITVQLTSIGKHQELFVKEIKENKIFIDINGMCKGKNDIHCYHIIHGTRKDVELIRNYQ